MPSILNPFYEMTQDISNIPFDESMYYMKLIAGKATNSGAPAPWKELEKSIADGNLKKMIDDDPT